MYTSAVGDYQRICLDTRSKKKHKNRQTQKNIHPTGCETETLIKWISLKIAEHSGFYSLFICAMFECSTIVRTKVIKA